MNTFNFIGKITGIDEARSGEGWTAVTFRVQEEKDQYPQVAHFSFFKKGEYEKYAQEFNTTYSIGDRVEVLFNMTTREWEGKYFPENGAWSVKKLDVEEQAKQTITKEVKEEKGLDYPEENISPDDIPF